MKLKNIIIVFLFVFSMLCVSAEYNAYFNILNSQSTLAEIGNSNFSVIQSWASNNNFPVISADVNSDGNDEVFSVYSGLLESRKYDSITNSYVLLSQTEYTADSSPFIFRKTDGTYKILAFNGSILFIYGAGAGYLSLNEEYALKIQANVPATSPKRIQSSINCFSEWGSDYCVIEGNKSDFEVINLTGSTTSKNYSDGRISKATQVYGHKVALYPNPDVSTNPTYYGAFYCNDSGVNYGIILKNLTDGTTFKANCSVGDTAPVLSIQVLKKSIDSSYSILYYAFDSATTYKLYSLNLVLKASINFPIALGSVDDTRGFCSIENGQYLIQNAKNALWVLNWSGANNILYTMLSSGTAGTFNSLLCGKDFSYGLGKLSNYVYKTNNTLSSDYPFGTILNVNFDLGLIESGKDNLAVFSSRIIQYTVPFSTFKFYIAGTNILNPNNLNYQLYWNASTFYTGGIAILGSDNVGDSIPIGNYEMRTQADDVFLATAKNFTITNGINTYNFNLTPKNNGTNLYLRFSEGGGTGNVITGRIITAIIYYTNTSNISLGGVLVAFRDGSFVTSNGTINLLDIPAGNYTFKVFAEGYESRLFLNFNLVGSNPIDIYLTPVLNASLCLPQISSIRVSTIKNKITFYPYIAYLPNAPTPPNNPCYGADSIESLNQRCFFINASDKSKGWYQEIPETIPDITSACVNQMLYFDLLVSKCDAERSEVVVSFDGLYNLDTGSIGLMQFDSTKPFKVSNKYNYSGNITFSAWAWSNSFRLYEAWGYSKSHGNINTKNLFIKSGGECPYALDIYGRVLENVSDLVQNTKDEGAFYGGWSYNLKIAIGLLVWIAVSLIVGIMVSNLTNGSETIFGITVGATGIVMSIILSTILPFLPAYFVLILIIFCIASIGLSITQKVQGG